MSTEPCGSLPRLHLNLSAHYCEHHQAWSTHFSVYRQTQEDDPERLEDDMERLAGADATWGPFDTWTDVEDWLAARLNDPTLLPRVSPGMPGRL